VTEQAVFRLEPQGVALVEVDYDAADNILFINFEGLDVMTEADAERLAEFMDHRLADLDGKDMVRRNEERCFTSSAKRSTAASTTPDRTSSRGRGSSSI
jgi:hypothetical protein